MFIRLWENILATWTVGDENVFDGDDADIKVLRYEATDDAAVSVYSDHLYWLVTCWSTARLVQGHSFQLTEFLKNCNLIIKKLLYSLSLAQVHS